MAGEMAVGEPGDTIAAKYRIERVIGQGGMGSVLAATHLHLGELVAVKVLNPGLAERPQLIERFMREARATLKIGSEHVVRVMDVDLLDNGAPYIVMEMLDGCDLAAHIKERGPMDVAPACEFLLQACDALAEAHAAGIVHRDLKPANLFLARRSNGQVGLKVLDFGISKLSEADNIQTQTGAILGTPYYMAPEQMKSATHADPRSDIWSLGVIFYQMLTQQLPFRGGSITELALAVVQTEPPSVTLHRADLPDAVAAIVLRCLSKAPEARFQTMAELAAALAPFAPKRARRHAERAASFDTHAPDTVTVATPPTPQGGAPPGGKAIDRTAADSAPTEHWPARAPHGPLTTLSGGAVHTGDDRPKPPTLLYALAALTVVAGLVVAVVLAMRGGAQGSPSQAARPAPTALSVEPDDSTSAAAAVPTGTEPAPVAPNEAARPTPTEPDRPPEVAKPAAAAPSPAPPNGRQDVTDPWASPPPPTARPQPPSGTEGNPSCGGYYCDGTNANCPNDCDANPDCATGSCVDGKCCDSACNGPCKACAFALNGVADGQCENVPVLTDPDGDCGGGETCDGSGNCKLDNGEPCVADGDCVSNNCSNMLCEV